MRVNRRAESGLGKISFCRGKGFRLLPASIKPLELSVRLFLQVAFILAACRLVGWVAARLRELGLLQWVLKRYTPKIAFRNNVFCIGQVKPGFGRCSPSGVWYQFQ